MLEKQQKNKKDKKVHAVFYQVGFILILYGENNCVVKTKRNLSLIKIKHLNILISLSEKSFMRNLI
jgi:hypothetical protein